MKRALVVVAHTDDETLGMGATISKLSRSGVEVLCMAFTDGVSSRSEARLEDSEIREFASNQAATELGFKWVRKLDYPDNQLDTISLLELTQHVEQLSSQFQPEMVFTHSIADLNVDHQLVARATITAFRPLVGSTIKSLRSFEVPSSTEFGGVRLNLRFNPNCYEEINEKDWTSKLLALEAYGVELRDPPHPRSIEVIASKSDVRGSESGFNKAECFESIIERFSS